MRIINLSRGADSEPQEEPTPRPTMRRKQISKSLGIETKVFTLLFHGAVKILSIQPYSYWL